MIVALAVALPAAAAELAAEVYRDDSITIRAGLQGSSSQVVHFGDVLVLIIAVSYDPDSVAVQELDAAFFTAAWPASNGARLVDWRVRHDRKSDSRLTRMHVAYRFQILGCPDDDTPTCPGDRVYALPEFVLRYEDLNASDDSSRLVRFRPWPRRLTVSTTLQSDEENQLLPFETYFPAGGFPDPMAGEDRMRKSFVAAGITLALLMGGLIMWPFRSRTQGKQRRTNRDGNNSCRLFAMQTLQTMHVISTLCGGAWSGTATTSCNSTRSSGWISQNPAMPPVMMPAMTGPMLTCARCSWICCTIRRDKASSSGNGWKK